MGLNQGHTTTVGSNTSQSNSTQSGSNTTTPIEDPLFTAFRQSLLPAISAQYQSAQTPLYGAPQIASMWNQQNQLANSGAQSLTNMAARSGQSQSGALTAGLTGLEQNRQSNATGFLNSIPALNQQYKDQSTQNLLNLATSFLGHSPIGQTSTSSGQSATNSSGMQNSTQTQYGPGLLSSILGFGSNLLSGGLFNGLFGGGSGGSGNNGALDALGGG